MKYLHTLTFTFLSITLPIFIFLSVSWSATYYIDYQNGLDSNNGTSKSTPWKRCPGMKGFSGSYSHSAGDHFIFKGGVTWPSSTLPLTVEYSGTSGNSDYYGADRTWFAGDSWSRPIFDGGQSLGANAYLIGATSDPKSYIVIDNLQLQNVGNPSDGSGTCVFFVGGTSIEVKNAWLQPEGIQAFAYASGRNNSSRIYFHDNFIRRAGRAVIYGEAGYVVHDIRVYNNDWQGMGNTYLGSYHTDGLMIGNPIGSSCTGTATVRDILFYNNFFYGDWSRGATAQYYSNGCTSNTTMYNNVFSYENTTGVIDPFFSPAFVVLGKYDGGDLHFYNNTFSNDANPGYNKGAKGGIQIINPAKGTLTIRGNIFSNTGNDILYADNFTSVAINFNLHYHPGFSGRLIWKSSGTPWECYTLSACQSHGMERDSPPMRDPKFVALPNGRVGSGSWRLQSSSPCKDAFPTAQAPTGTFTADIVGAPRPQSSAWDIGAYEYMETGSTSSRKP